MSLSRTTTTLRISPITWAADLRRRLVSIRSPSPEDARRPPVDRTNSCPHGLRVGGSRPAKTLLSSHERSQERHRSGHRARRGGRGRGAARARAGNARSICAAAGPLAAGRAAIARHAKHAPSSPGVYRMIDADGDVLYVGKAKNIRKRIIAYTRPTGYDPRIERMIAATAALEFVSTATETEALLLEANLIKRLRPRFNVLLRDDKSFPYILITGDHWAPQILKHRGARGRAGNYYGPFASVWAVNRTITALQRAFLLRSCSDGFFESRTRPCLLHQIKRCSGPCTREIDFAEYGELVREANAFLSGKSQRGEGRARRRDGEGLGGARFRARRDLSRPPRRALGGAVASGHQSARRRGGRRVRRPPGRRLQLRRGVLLPHRPELGQSRLFPEGRPLAGAGRGAGRIPRPVLRRQAVPALHLHLARDRGARAAGRGLEHQERPQGRGERAAARREEGARRPCARQCARGARPQARRHLLAAQAAGSAGRALRAAAGAAAHRGLRQQPHPGHQRGRRHDRRRAGGLPQEPVPQVQHPLGRARAGRRLRHDARGA